uniref:Uncharacterized protein n=1 Tax=Plectus sambesii TaxID=2011161 RepID=A0A914VC10_9BILA
MASAATTTAAASNAPTDRRTATSRLLQQFRPIGAVPPPRFAAKLKREEEHARMRWPAVVGPRLACVVAAASSKPKHEHLPDGVAAVGRETLLDETSAPTNRRLKPRLVAAAWCERSAVREQR